MAEEWDTATKIGSKVRGGPAAPREKVIRGESALNAARRTGAEIATEKKFGGTNQVSCNLHHTSSLYAALSGTNPCSSKTTC